jgi:alpha-galactosidase
VRLEPLRVEAEVDREVHGAPLTGSGTVVLGPLEVTLHAQPPPAWPSVTWELANRGDRPVSVRSVSLVHPVDAAREPIRMFRHGYQSWSPSGVATFGVGVDPSTRARFESVQAVFHADQRTVPTPEELRSEWVTVLADASGATALVGFEAASEHDGTLRLRRARDRNGIELSAEAFLGGAVLAPGERRALHGVLIDGGGNDRPVGELLERWAVHAGRVGRARTDAPYQVGWCSWYQYFDAVTEDAFLANLGLADAWPFDVFQLDDGFQSSVGDWLVTNETFPSGLEAMARAVTAAGRRPGIWSAPFLAAPDSELARAHPDWLARHREPDGSTAPLYPWWNPAWGGGADGFMCGLDTTRPEVLAHLEELAAALVAMGFRYLKLDFTFAPSVDGVWADPSRTPAQRVRAGFEAIRRGAGDGAFVLGCGVPLGNVVGLVDGNRIGPDVAPLWELEASAEIVPGYLGVQPATAHAYQNTLARSFMHRRLWLNDPDCVMLRASGTDLSAAPARTWARTVGMSGGMALVSDDLALLDAEARALFGEVLSLGRAADEEARSGRPAVAPDLLEHCPPTTFAGGGHVLVTDPTRGTSELDA